ncbi:sensor histidine kinase [Ferruginibacter sp.]
MCNKILCKKYYCLLFCLLSFISSVCIAQNDHAKVLLDAYEQLKNGYIIPPATACTINEKASVEENIQQALQNNSTGNWQCCLQMLQALQAKANKLSLKENLHLLLARADYYNSHQSFDSAQALATQANEVAAKNNWLAEETKALLILSSGALKRRNISASYAWADSALQLSRKDNNDRLQGQALLQMAFCARRNFTSSLHRAFPYYLQASEMAEKSGDSATLFSANIFLADDNFENEQWDAGMPYFKRAVAIALNTKNVHVTCILYSGLGFPLAKQNYNNEALVLYRRSLQLSLQQNFPYDIQHSYFAIAGTLENVHQYDSALVYADLAGSVAGVDSLISNIWWMKGDFYNDMGNYKAAATMYSKALNWATADFLYRNQDQLSGYEAKLKTSEKELLVVQEKKRSLQLEWIIGGVAVLLVMAAMAYLFQNRSKKKLALQHSIIQTQRQELEQSLQEKDILLREIHHRVKNNLSVIGSLLELQSSGMEDEKAKAAITEGQSRVHAIALIHQRLYQHENLAAIELGGFINDMIKDVSSVFKIPGQKITPNVNVPHTLLDIDTAVPLGLIMNELLTNSFKYAFTTAATGMIDIRLAATDEAGNYTVTYFDNGPGMPAGFDLKKSRSLGLRLIHRLSSQIGGSAQYVAGEGCKFIIHFKDAFTRNNDA